MTRCGIRLLITSADRPERKHARRGIVTGWKRLFHVGENLDGSRSPSMVTEAARNRDSSRSSGLVDFSYTSRRLPPSPRCRHRADTSRRRTSGTPRRGRCRCARTPCTCDEQRRLTMTSASTSIKAPRQADDRARRASCRSATACVVVRGSRRDDALRRIRAAECAPS